MTQALTLHPSSSACADSRVERRTTSRLQLSVLLELIECMTTTSTSLSSFELIECLTRCLQFSVLLDCHIAWRPPRILHLRAACVTQVMTAMFWDGSRLGGVHSAYLVIVMIPNTCSVQSSKRIPWKHALHLQPKKTCVIFKFNSYITDPTLYFHRCSNRTRMEVD